MYYQAGSFPFLLPEVPATKSGKWGISTKLSEFLTYTTYQLHTLYPYRNIQSNNITHTSLKTNSKQASTNDSALPPSVHCLSITAFRLHVSALLPSDYWLGISAFGPTSHHNNQIYSQAHNIPQNLTMSSTTRIHPKSHTSYSKGYITSTPCREKLTSTIM